MAATHVFVELSRAIGCYNIYVTLEQLPATLQVRLTPTPECLYLQITADLVLVIPLAAPAPNTEAATVDLKDGVLTVRLPCQVEPSDVSYPVPVHSLQSGQLMCGFCEAIVACGLEQVYELPELDWEELSELWNCHPSHHQKNPLVLEPYRYCLCRYFMAKLHAVLHPDSSSGLEIIGQASASTVVSYLPVACQKCSKLLGEVKMVPFRQVNGHARQFTLQLNRIKDSTAHWSLLALVVRQLALVPDFDYRRTLALAALEKPKSLLISVSAKNAMVLRNGKYQEAIKCLYELGEMKDLNTQRICSEDFEGLLEELKKRNRYLPVSLRKVGPKRLAYLVYSEILP